MSEAVNMHKRIAMGGESEANHLKKGGKAKVKKYAKGGQVEYEGSASKTPAESSHQKNVNKIGAYPEKKIAKLPAKGNVTPLTKPMPNAIATMKKGGHAVRKSGGRGR